MLSGTGGLRGREGEKCWLSPAENADYFLAHLDPFFFFFLFWGVQDAEVYREAKLRVLGHQESLLVGCVAQHPGAFTATSVVSLMKTHFFRRKTKKFYPGCQTCVTKRWMQVKPSPAHSGSPFLNIFSVSDTDESLEIPCLATLLINPLRLFSETPSDATLRHHRVLA